MMKYRPLTLVPGLCGPLAGMDVVQSCLTARVSAKVSNQIADSIHTVRREPRRARVVVGLPTYIRKDPC